MTKTVNGQSVPFLFGVRAFEIIGNCIDEQAVSKIAQAISTPSIKVMTYILYAGHENACFYDKTNPIYNSPEEMYNVIDEIGITEATEIYNKALLSFMSKSETQTAKKK